MKNYQRLKDLREDKDLFQSQIAEILKTSQKQYSRWETGEYQIPFDKAIELSEYYQVSLDYIAGRTNDKRGIGYTKQVTDKNKPKENNISGKYNITQSNSGGMNNISIKDK